MTDDERMIEEAFKSAEAHSQSVKRAVIPITPDEQREGFARNTGLKADCGKPGRPTPSEARVAVYLVWVLYRKWRLWRLDQLWLDGYGPDARPDCWQVECGIRLSKLIARLDIYEGRHKEMMARFDRGEEGGVAWHHPEELLERYLPLFESQCNLAELDIPPVPTLIKAIDAAADMLIRKSERESGARMRFAATLFDGLLRPGRAGAPALC